MHILKVFYCVISNFTLNPLAALVYKGIKRLYTYSLLLPYSLVEVGCCEAQANCEAMVG